MERARWDEWLRGWLKRHPLPEPPEELRRDYTRQVMERLRPQPVPVFFRPRPVFGLAGALAAALAIAVIIRAPARTVHPPSSPDRIVLADAAAEEALHLWEEMETAEESVPGTASDDALEEELLRLDQSELAIS